MGLPLKVSTVTRNSSWVYWPILVWVSRTKTLQLSMALLYLSWQRVLVMTVKTVSHMMGFNRIPVSMSR